MKTYFKLKDNVLDKKILSYIESKLFASRKEVHTLIDNFVTCYAVNFTNGKLHL
jgi:hypothetical protein